MTQIDYSRAAKYFLLQDFLGRNEIGAKVFLCAQGNGELPHEKGPLSRGFAVNMRCAAIRMAKSAALPANCARLSVPRRPLPLTQNREMMAAGGRRAMTST